jgi:hypothetical protein
MGVRMIPPDPPDCCPVHYLDRQRTVWLIYGGTRQPWNAGLLCDTWHFVAPIREVFTRALNSVVEPDIELTDVFPGGD